MTSLNAWFENLLFGCAGEADSAETHGASITVIGSGGKTSLIWHLSASFAMRSGRKILVTPATKMFVPPPETKLYDRYYGRCNDGILPEPVPGITLAGHFNETNGKLESLPPSQLEKMLAGYDLVLIEGDGSRGLPLKAWTKNEPVIPSSTSLCIGMLPLWPLGKPVSESLVHRLPLFLALTGAGPGEPIRPEHIERLITGRQAESGAVPLPGLFTKARGKKVLFFNQIENEGALTQAREMAELLPPRFREGLCGIIAGSVRDDCVVEL